jgi:hypothetical protein
MTVALGIPPAIMNLVQEGLIERAFFDGLYPNLAYRSEALVEEWAGNTGVETFMSRPGLLRPVVKPIAPGVDPTPQALAYEQWVARLERFTGTIDTHMPTSAVANANLFMRNIHQLGLQAGQSVNRIVRNAMFKAYLGGQTVLTVGALAGDTTIQVASLNGFTDVMVPGTNVRPQPVSPTTPLQVTLGTATVRNVIGYSPADPNDLSGPGTLLLSAAVGGAGLPARSAVLSAYKPAVLRSGGGDSVDAIGGSDTFVLQDAINAVAILRRHNVQPHESGFYHCHISPQANAQVFADPVFQRLNTALPEHAIYKEGFIGTLSGVLFMLNTESPEYTNCGDRVATGVRAFYSSDVGAETTNENGINVGRIILTGKGSVYERWLNEDAYVSEAGITGKIADFELVNNGIAISTERIRLILRAPIDRLQDIVAATWSISTCFPVPSDLTASSGNEKYKRAVVIEHAL